MPFELSARLTQIAQAVMPEGMIADMVSPRVAPLPDLFQYTDFNVADRLTIPDTRVSDDGAVPQVNFASSLVEAALEDHGLEAPVSNREVERARRMNIGYDPVDDAAQGAAELVRLAREKRIADQVADTANYAAGLFTTLAGNSQWDDAASDPHQAILEALDKPLVRPNTIVFGQSVWTKVRSHPKMVAAVNVTAGGGLQQTGSASKEAVAAALEVDRVLVGRTRYQSAQPGQAENYTWLWPKICALLHINPAVRSTSRSPSFCWTAAATADIEMMIGEDERRGVKGSTVPKVVDLVKELVPFDKAGYVFKAAVA